MNVGVVIVDYINQVKRSSLPSRGGQYDWTEQIEVSKALKSMAQEYEVLYSHLIKLMLVEKLGLQKVYLMQQMQPMH